MAARPAILAAALLVALQVAGKAVRDAFFLTHFPVTSLPAVAAAAAGLSLVSAIGFARGMTALAPARLVPAALVASGLLQLGEWGLALYLPRAAALVFYAHQAVFGAALVSGFWSLFNERFDPHAAKRAVGPVGAGAALGGVVGGLLTWQAAAFVSLPGMLALMAGLSFLSLPAVLALRPAVPAPTRAGVAVPESPRPPGLLGIFSEPYLRNLALAVGLVAFLEAPLDYLLNAAAAASFAESGRLLSFFALFNASIGLVTLAAQAALVRPALAGLGVAGTLAAPPAFALAGSALALGFPGLWAFSALRVGHGSLRSSLFRAGYELLYTPLPPERKRPAKMLVDVGVDRLGTMAGSAAVALVLAFSGSLSTVALLVLAGASAAVLLVLVPRFRRGYVGALAGSLRSGVVKLDPDEVIDATTRLTIASLHGEVRGAPGAGPAAALLQQAADLQSGDPARVGRVLERGELPPQLVSHAIPLLAREDLVSRIVPALRQAAARNVGQLVDALLDPRLGPAVRRRIPRVLRAVHTQRAVDGLLLGSLEPRFDVRERCARALLHLKERGGAALSFPRDRIVAAAAKAAEQAGESEAHLDHLFTLLSILLEREPLEIARRALRGKDAALRGTALEYLENVVPDPVLQRLRPHLGATATLGPALRPEAEVRDVLLRSAHAAPGLAADSETAGGRRG